MDARVTALSGERLTTRGLVMDRSEYGIRIILNALVEPGPLTLGQIFKVEIGDDVVVSELLAYRSEQGGYCLLLAVVHSASAKQLTSLLREFEPELMLDTPAAVLRPTAKRAPGPARDNRPGRFGLKPLVHALTAQSQLTTLGMAFAAGVPSKQVFSQPAPP